MEENSRFPATSPDTVPITKRKRKVRISVIPSTNIIFRKALSLVRPINMYKRIYCKTNAPNTMWVITSTTAIDSRVPEKKTENTGIPSPICLPIVYKRIGMNTITIKAATAPEHNTVKK